MTLTEAGSLCSSLMTPSQKKASTGLSNRYHNGPLDKDMTVTVVIICGVNDTQKIHLGAWLTTELGRMAGEVKPGKHVMHREGRPELGIFSTTPTFSMNSV